ncbi:APC family permease [Heyndrickxia acidiproducens]|uniref:APC family permease n=1 Tax=Heyndrickxia acidiproducens TaxID=1121084 RepID=UPI00035D1C5D|nr:APC family permease [Heyndrickxia acidiproducens]
MENHLHLKRTLKLPQIILFGLAYMAPMIVFGTYGVLAETTHGTVPAAYIVALAAMLFTAYSYGKMVKAFPKSGSAYTYTRKAIHPHLGFMIGWAVLLDYIFLPMVIWLIGAVYLNSAFPSVPSWVWIIGFIAITSVINLISVKMTSNVNMLMMVFQFLVVAIFLALSVADIVSENGSHALFSSSPFFNTDASLAYILAGASIACYSFLGFDAVTTMSEETIHPEKTLPKAIFLITLIGGIIFILSSYFLHLVQPIYTNFKNMDSAAIEIAKQIGGNIFSAIFLSGIIIAQFASGVAAQASGARLLYAMGRDSVLPVKIFGYLNSKTKTPIIDIVLIGIIALFALNMDITTSTSFVNFGAFLTFIFVNLDVIFFYYIRGKQRSGKNMLLYLLVPLIGACLDFGLFLNLDKNAKILGCIWAAIGLIYLAFLTKGFKTEPPELDFESTEKPVELPLSNIKKNTI